MLQLSGRLGNTSSGFAQRRAVVLQPASRRSFTARCPVNERLARSVLRRATIEKVTAEELEVAIQEREVPLIIDFYATWCGPCLMLAQELEKVAKDMEGSVKILKLDVDAKENQELSSQLQIQGLPTMIFIGMDKDKPALRTEGLLPASTIKDIVSKEL